VAATHQVKRNRGRRGASARAKAAAASAAALEVPASLFSKGFARTFNSVA
jgi:hypothetical protein